MKHKKWIGIMIAGLMPEPGAWPDKTWSRFPAYGMTGVENSQHPSWRNLKGPAIIKEGFSLSPIRERTVSQS